VRYRPRLYVVGEPRLALPLRRRSPKAWAIGCCAVAIALGGAVGLLARAWAWAR
jgi:hypothetical protein